ncbi:MAG: hypothetical protein C0401_00960 [Anaerolinea sp.]|nr:hypothetical protein [Anaerolinea sp.]
MGVLVSLKIMNRIELSKLPDAPSVTLVETRWSEFGMSVGPNTRIVPFWVKRNEAPLRSAKTATDAIINICMFLSINFLK